MKRFICITLALCCLLTLVSCSADKPKGDCVCWFSDGLSENDIKDFEPEELPGARLYIADDDNEELHFESDGKAECIITGTPIKDAYLTDLNGDGYKELCCTVYFGFGFVSEEISVYDLKNREYYHLGERFSYDYSLYMSDGALGVRKTACYDGIRETEAAEEGYLSLKDGVLEFVQYQ